MFLQTFFLLIETERTKKGLRKDVEDVTWPWPDQLDTIYMNWIGTRKKRSTLRFLKSVVLHVLSTTPTPGNSYLENFTELTICADKGSVYEFYSLRR